MTAIKVAFMGSPEFAVPCLRAVAAAHEVVLVVSQPDKPAGRGGQLASPAVKRAADELGLRTIQPKSARTGELADALATSGAELAIVVAYGKILPPAVLTAVPRGCINVHGSLLPKYRGAAPVQWAVINGDPVTGVSIMQLDEGMDTGPVYVEREIAIDPRETSGELLSRLAPIGAAALLEIIASLASGTAQATPQDHSAASHARMLEKTDGAIDFAGSAIAIASRIRGVDPWPGAYATLRGQPVKLFRALATGLPAAGLPAVNRQAAEDANTAPRIDRSEGSPADRTPGTVVAIDRDGVHVLCSDGVVVIAEVQAAGRKRMAASQFAAGRGIAVGDVLT
jgi:methionyl-tRNA formyltransferase